MRSHEEFRNRGVRTVLGGIHPSMCPEEAGMYCDSVVIGEAEHIWATLLKDAEDGCLKRVYRAEAIRGFNIFPRHCQVAAFPRQISAGYRADDQGVSLPL